MDDSPIRAALDLLLLVLTVLCLTAVVVVGSRAAVLAVRARRQGMPLGRETDGGKREVLRRALREGADGIDLVELRHLAEELRSRRPRWFAALFVAVQLGAALSAPPPWHLLLLGLLILAIVIMLVAVERNARVAGAFLRRYPVPTLKAAGLGA
ncbi:hypothetical protein [Kineosporia babensis]|uniref:Uncharacterized protein n=1 Tax=Kineosporia babensis TaxID=499548 RepID=A0A9X1NHJ6_9ACTN|nr:hypothetical protein [Kineosporia babensis]MCD5315197.1 hypothetical protein [Kineosporia babensis]